LAKVMTAEFTSSGVRLILPLSPVDMRAISHRLRTGRVLSTLVPVHANTTSPTLQLR
jgi:hypothetical protein